MTKHGYKYDQLVFLTIKIHERYLCITTEQQELIRREKKPTKPICRAVNFFQKLPGYPFDNHHNLLLGNLYARNLPNNYNNLYAITQAVKLRKIVLPNH